MGQIDLREYESSAPKRLSARERRELKSAVDSLTIESSNDDNSEYIITASSTVGAVEIGDLSVLIRPKIGIPQLLSLACYASNLVKLQIDQEFHFADDPESLPDVLALLLLAAARRAFSRGLLRGYRVEEEALNTVRGRIRFEDQIRSRFDVPIPIEVRYDEFTDDILENRLVKAAVMRLGAMRLRSPRARSGLGWIASTLQDVSNVEFPSKQVPAPVSNQLNEHYREVLTLSRLILRHSTFHQQRGQVRSFGFLINMNELFQEFLIVALREAIGLTPRVFCADNQLRGRRSIHLDEAHRVNLKPDMTWWEGDKCVFVGDAKYKKTDGIGQHSDLYQLLAYVTALNLPGGMLIYAAGETNPVLHRVKHTGKWLEVVGLELSGTLNDVLARINEVAKRVKILRQETFETEGACFRCGDDFIAATS